MAADAVHSTSSTLRPPLRYPLLLGQWLAIAWSREIEPGTLLGRRLMGLDLVLWRSGETLHCWRDLCMHRGARLSLGTVRTPTSESNETPAIQDCLVCPYHAWEYAPSGQCVHIPAQPGLTPPDKARATTYSVKERYGVVWVALDEPRGPLPDFQIAEEPAYRTVLAGPYRFYA